MEGATEIKAGGDEAATGNVDKNVTTATSASGGDDTPASASATKGEEGTELTQLAQESDEAAPNANGDVDSGASKNMATSAPDDGDAPVLEKSEAEESVKQGDDKAEPSSEGNGGSDKDVAPSVPGGDDAPAPAEATKASSKSEGNTDADDASSPEDAPTPRRSPRIVTSLRWAEGLSEITRYKEEHGNCNAKSATGLGRWAKRQRQRKRIGTLPEDRVEALDKLGFDWTLGEPKAKAKAKAAPTPKKEGTPTKKRGRPRKSTDSGEAKPKDKATPTEKRGRGRPRKDTDLGEPKPEDEATPTQKRGRGRPKKGTPKEATSKKRKATPSKKKATPASNKRRKLEEGSQTKVRTSMKVWNARIWELKEYKEEHGNIDIPQEGSLYQWCKNQRKKYTEGNLSEEHIRELEELGFEWQEKEKEKEEKKATKVPWEDTFAQLEEYKKEHGDCDVPKSSKLHTWCKNQRHNYKEGNLTLDQIRQLEALDFPWTIRTPERRDEQTKLLWETRLAELIEYKEEHGHCSVKDRSTPLGKWVDVQRTKKKQGKISDERIQRLDEVGFVWGKPRKAPQENVGWEFRFKELKEFAEEHGHCRVPRQTGKVVNKLNTWISDQRSAYRKGKLSEERIEQLEELGLGWDSRKSAKNPEIRLNWDERIAQLKRHKEEQGNLNLRGDSGLGGWAKTQRRKKKKGLLSEEEIRELDELGFDWSLLRKRPSPKVVTEADINLSLTAPPGRVGLTVQFDDGGGALISEVQPTSPFGVQVSAGDRLVTIDGTLVLSMNDLAAGADNERTFGFVIKKESLPSPKKAKKSPKADSQFEKRFNELLAYNEQHGDCQVPQREGELGRWVKNMRYSKSKLSESRIQRLEEIGFTWSSDNTRAGTKDSKPRAVTANSEHEALWEENFNRLRRFGEENGHFKAPLATHPQLKRWIDRQRHNHKQGKVTEARIAQLESIGFELTTGAVQVSFEDRLEQLQEYSQHFGNCDIPLSHPVLGKWAWHQRNEYKKMNLSDARVKSLEAAGFDWQLSFEERLTQLQQYSVNYNGSNPPKDHAVLGGWITHMREAHRKRELSEECEMALEAVGFQWTSAPPKLVWGHRYELLKQYTLENGHCNAPRSHPQLGTWIDNQRRAYKKGKLSQEKITALEELGIKWGTIQKDPELSWREQYNELCLYKAEHGHCNVPQTTTGLGRFVHWQRYTRKKGKLPEERVNLLNEIGFNWGTDAPGPTLTWDERFAHLQRYVAKHGTWLVPRNEPHLVGLGNWLSNQRYKFDKMPEEQRNALIGLGVTPIGNVKKETWDNYYSMLCSHKEEHGDCNHSEGLDADLEKWVHNQRKYFKNGKLAIERVDRLRNIGFEFDLKAVADYHITVPPGDLGLTLKLDDKIVGAEITAIDSSCTFKHRISVGYRLVTIDGARITKEEDLVKDSERKIGILREKPKRSPKKASASSEGEISDDEGNGEGEEDPLAALPLPQLDPAPQPEQQYEL